MKKKPELQRYYPCFHLVHGDDIKRWDTIRREQKITYKVKPDSDAAKSGMAHAVVCYRLVSDRPIWLMNQHKLVGKRAARGEPG